MKKEMLQQISMPIPREDEARVEAALSAGRRQYGSMGRFVLALVKDWYDGEPPQAHAAPGATTPTTASAGPVRVSTAGPSTPPSDPDDDDDAWDDEANDARPEDEDDPLFD